MSSISKQIDVLIGFLFIAVNPADSPSKPLGRFINSPYPARSVDCVPGEQVYTYD
jgi:hypothetical protein